MQVASDGLVARLVLAILAVVFVPLGVAYLVVGALGGPDGFLVLGPIFLATGLLLAVAWMLWRKRARAADARETALRRARARATVVDLELHPYVRVGTFVTVTLTVRFAGGTYDRRLRVSPLLRLERGSEIAVAYDLGDPANFLPEV